MSMRFVYVLAWPVPMSDTYPPEDDKAVCARWLMLIHRELQELGIDPLLIHLDDDGVTLTDMTLTDELFLIATRLDFDAAMAQSRENRAGRE